MRASATLIYDEAGIRLGADKKTMLEVRIKRRLKALDLDSYSQYCDYLFGREGLKEELVPLIDVVTTNKTDFFREPKHFNFLVGEALPELTARDGGGRPLLIWSAGCSSGEEPYTLAMVLSEYAADPSRLPLQNTGHRYLDQCAGEGRDGRLLERCGRARCRRR